MKYGRLNQINRDKWLKAKLDELTPGLKVLDAGAGQLKYKKFCKHLEYVAQDFNQYDGVGDSSGLQKQDWDQSEVDIVSDIVAIPVENASFDVVLCVEVLEHLPDPVKALEEFMRVLKPGGILILTAPYSSLTHFSPYHYYSGFNLNFYKYHLEKLGIKIEELQSNGDYFEFLAQEVTRIGWVVQNYTNTKLNVFERVVLSLVNSILGKYSRLGQASSELMCFGYHVLAKKCYENPC